MLSGDRLGRVWTVWKDFNRVSKSGIYTKDTYSFESFPGLYRNQSTFPWPRLQPSPRMDVNSASVRPGASLLMTTFSFGDRGLDTTERGPFPEV